MTTAVRASRRKHHIIYKTTCLVTGRWYIGMHSTDDLDDGYQGSGTFLWKSIKKHGKEKHVTVILEHLPDRHTLGLREEEILTKEFRADPLCMNFRSGGTGNQPGASLPAETKAKVSAALKAHYASEHGQQTRQRLSEAITGLSRSEETRTKMSIGSKSKPKSDAHRASMSATRKGKTQSPERKARTRTGRERPCTLDGVKIYPSHAALVKDHGHGKNGGRSPLLRYL